MLSDEDLNELARLLKEGPTRRACPLDPDTWRYLSGGRKGRERQGVEVDIGYEFTPFAYEKLTLAKAEARIMKLDEARPFPGSLDIRKARPGWFIQRSTSDTLKFKGVMGWLPMGPNRAFVAVLVGPSHAYGACVVRDPDYRKFLNTTQPEIIHRD